MVGWASLFRVLQYTRAVKPPLQYEPLPPHRRNPLSRLILDSLATLGDTRKERLTVLVDVQVGNNQVRGGKANWNALAVGLLTNDTLDVHNVLQTVHGGDATLTALLGATSDGDSVVNAEGNSADL